MHLPASLSFVLLASVAALCACSNAPATSAAKLPPVTPIMIPPAMPAAATGTLAGPVWQWHATQAGASFAPERYTLQFTDDGRVLVRADCNRGSGRYTAEPGGRLSLTPIALTKMGCPAGSLDTAFVRGLGEVTAYRVQDGTLELTLRDGRNMTLGSVWGQCGVSVGSVWGRRIAVPAQGGINCRLVAGETLYRTETA